MAPLARAILVHGVLGYGLISSSLMLGWDTLDGSLPAWPKPLFKYPLMCVLGGALWGYLMWLWRPKERSQPSRP